MKPTNPQEVIEALRRYDDHSIKVVDLPHYSFYCTSALAKALHAAGYKEAPRTVLNAKGWWNLTIGELQAKLLEGDEG